MAWMEIREGIRVSSMKMKEMKETNRYRGGGGGRDMVQRESLGRRGRRSWMGKRKVEMAGAECE